MTSLFTDYGYGGDIVTTNAPDKFTIIRNYDPSARFLYLASQHIEDIRIAASSLDYAAERAQAMQAREEKLEELKQSALNCQAALAAVIAKLCREPNYGAEVAA
jgi:hypothetical protein